MKLLDVLADATYASHYWVDSWSVVNDEGESVYKMYRKEGDCSEDVLVRALRAKNQHNRLKVETYEDGVYYADYHQLIEGKRKGEKEGYDDGDSLFQFAVFGELVYG